MASASLLAPGRHDPLSTITLDGISISATDSGDSDADDSFHDAEDAPRSTKEQQRAGQVDNDDDDDDDDDAPPAFPSLNSAQRQSGAPPSSSSSSSSKPSSAAAFLQSIKAAPPSSAAYKASKDAALMPPPPPTLGGGGGGGGAAAAAGGLRVPTRGNGSGGGLAVPPSTSALSAPPGVGGASGATLNKGEKKRKKVALAPGCSPLDWARLKNSTDLRGGITQLMRVTPSELKKHNTRTDAWSAFYGKVYNITPYLRFHPGGEDDLLRVAGRDGTRLFALTHSWVNIDAMIDTAMVGVLVSE
ncbi:uncharacterized protein PFL1_03792 [Pseudozyma flocculosa PF-1]|uniref:Cytochrome b5 heme-binding domain-containing protein n=2 Tax=Pseudozyma flocculosa TaxID=84751 RepID=A0A5C3EW27_9BASI|nr:uncharacterized protein PFL1_03792 [Pseudozyma flocculosa PF-1]EPQ28489.1 hypothetical protein PFL1_03792 [Pseudozyma flocculosa PF-1]SPO36408.1 uncharacterized protein PSFLO_01879 [Pseudozyma flocculosa]